MPLSSWILLSTIKKLLYLWGSTEQAKQMSSMKMSALIISFTYTACRKTWDADKYVQVACPRLPRASLLLLRYFSVFDSLTPSPLNPSRFLVVLQQVRSIARQVVLGIDMDAINFPFVKLLQYIRIQQSKSRERSNYNKLYHDHASNSAVTELC